MRPCGLRHYSCWLSVLTLASSVSVLSARPVEVSPASTRPAATQPAVATSRPTTTAASIDPQTILQQLSSTDWHQRKAATETLVALGEPGKPFIEDLIKQATDSEARNNAQSAIVQIDDNRIAGASYITLHLKNVPAAKAIAELAPQTFTTLPTVPDNLWQQGGFGVVNIDVDHVPFWEVAPKICSQLGVDFRPYQNNVRIMRGGGQMTGLSHVEGAFLIVANQLSYQRTRNLGAAGRDQPARFGITMSIFPEPKITVLSGGGAVKLDEVVDDHGNSLIPKRTRNPGFISYSGFGGQNLYANLQYPTKDPGTRIVRFRGSTTFTVQTKARDFEVKNPADAHDVPTSISGLQVMFRDLKAKPDFYEVRMSVAQSQMQHPQFQTLQNQLQSRMQLLDAEGNEFDHRGMGSNMTGSTYEFTVQYARNNNRGGGGNPNRAPAKLSWQIPLESREITVPIRFDDIPLFDEN